MSDEARAWARHVGRPWSAASCSVTPTALGDAPALGSERQAVLRPASGAVGDGQPSRRRTISVIQAGANGDVQFGGVG
ncbi:hypothetical protein GCM10023403_29490 [Pseudonocardia benzenivorans]